MLKSPWLRGFILAALLAPLALQAQALKREGHYWVYESTQTHELGAGGRLEMENIHGDVTVEAWDQNRVEVQERLRLDVFTEGEAQTVVEKTRMASKVEEGTLFIGGPDYDREWIEAHFVVRVPSRFQCRLQIRAGALSIAGLQGKLAASTGAGHLDVRDIDGPAKLFTGAGNIHIQHITGDLAAETGAGEIELETCGATADLRSGAGEISTKDVSGFLTVASGAGALDVRSASAGADLNTGAGDISLRDAGGDITVQSGGGAVELIDCRGNLRVSTGGGALEARRIQGRLAMSTGGGEIELVEMLASLDVATGGGDITVDMARGEWETEPSIVLGTEGGDITLTLPDPFPADIEAVIRYRRRDWESFRIDSDFPLAIGQQEDGRYQVIEGRGKVNGGGATVRLKTENGDIRIRRR